MKRPYQILVVAALVLIGGAAFLTFNPFSNNDAVDEAASSDKKILYWVAPMDANYRRDEPGKSPMGMDLIPVYEGQDNAGGADASSVQIDPSVVNNIGVRTAKVETASLRPPIHTVGRIMFDEERIAHIHLRASGWIERLAVRAEGEAVKKGDLLFEVYSPDLVNAQAEFLQAVKSGRAQIVSASRDRLRALGISQTQIKEIETTKKTNQYVKVFAPITGVVTALNVADGQFVKPDTEIMALADLSIVWLMSDVFEANAGQLKKGAAVKAESKFEPGNIITGVVDYIYPDLDPVTRTVPVRTVLNNPDENLKPGMFMTVEIEGPLRPEATVIPREALIRTGREERVILALDNGRFQPAAVTSGMESGGKVEILSGLNAGETVVASGQFLIDSESSFAGASLRLEPSQTAAPMKMNEQASNDEGMSHDHAASDAEDQETDHSAHTMSMDEPMMAQAEGVLEEIMPEHRKVRLNHGPIPALGMSAMTMNFTVMKSVDLSAFEPGARVQFSIGEHEGNPYVIHQMETAP
ncbi:MAG: hemolysin D [Hyphococcus sp.]|nr:MAG: hemolysin D [Marinicaulis sp.]